MGACEAGKDIQGEVKALSIRADKLCEKNSWLKGEKKNSETGRTIGRQIKAAGSRRLLKYKFKGLTLL